MCEGEPEDGEILGRGLRAWEGNQEMGWDGGRGGLGGREQGAEAQLPAPGQFFCLSLKSQTWN